jgi:hypothetical protein
MKDCPPDLDLRVVNEGRSIVMHRLVADQLRGDPTLIQRARDRVAAWMRSGSIHPTYGEAWLELLTGPIDELLRALTDPGDAFRALRQCSPFAGVLDARTRWAVWREHGSMK